jgi:hypothetical protein
MTQPFGMAGLLSCVLALLANHTGKVAAQTVSDQPTDEQRPLTWRTSRLQVALFPAGDVYPVYVADLHRPTNTVTVGFYSRARIPEAGHQRTLLSGGGHVGVLRIDDITGGRTWQISLDAGFDAQFDSQFKNDGLGWDGNYGLTVTTARAGSRLGLKVAILHMSAHLGDEYEERVPTERINYTREEVAFGASWRPHRRWRTYGELGLAYRMRSDDQDHWRLQVGAEVEARPTVLGGRFAWFAAADFSGLEERDWRLDTSVQGGLVTRSGGRAYRLFAGWYDGRPTVGQFTYYSEAAFLMGFKVDL